VETPDIAEQVAGIEIVGDMVAVEVRRRHVCNAVAAAAAGTGRGTGSLASAQVVKRLGARIRSDRHDVDAGVAAGAAESIAENDRPSAVVQAADQWRAVGITQVNAATRGGAGAGDVRGV